MVLGYNERMVTKHGLTVEEYLALPEEKPYLEYANGEVVPKMAPDRKHAGLAGEISYRLGSYRREHGGFFGPEGRVGFLDRRDTRFLLPDVAYWAPGREVGERILAPPTLAIEIRSADQAMAGLREKCRYYREHGVDVCWLVDPVGNAVEVFEGPKDGLVVGPGGVLESVHLPGFAIDVEELFAAVDS